MKMVMVMCAGEHLEDLRRLVDGHHVHGYTEIPSVLGSGTTGRKLGTRAWPGTSSIIFTAVDDDKAAELIADLEALGKRCGPGEGLRVVVLPVERMI